MAPLGYVSPILDSLFYSDRITIYPLQILNLRYFNNLFRSFFTEIDDMVRSVIISRMPIVIEQGVHHSTPLLSFRLTDHIARCTKSETRS
jgi:hypothetical protein